jgi:DNA polymerase-3 subunit gamma/tau
MNYEVLARKWRPQTFEILAKVINCTDLQGGNPCNKCPSCTGVMQGKNLDVMEIDGASHTGINEVRDLQESIGYVPSQFANKVYIIDEVHMLSTHAFNALLKTLEEPPGHVYFIFATTAAHKIPDTIKSRCQRHQFKRLEVGEIAEHLEKICKAEKVEWDEDALRLLARKAEGSMRDGESLLDQCITASSGKVQTGLVRDILGLLDQEMVADFLKIVASRDSTEVLRRLDHAIHQGVDIEELLNALIEGYRDLMVLATPGDLSELVFRSADEVEVFKGILDTYELPDIVTIVERMCNAAPRLKMAADPRILMESVLVDLALLDRQSDIRQVISSIKRTGGPGVDSEAEPRKARSRGPGKSAEPDKEASSRGGGAKYLGDAGEESFAGPAASPPSDGPRRPAPKAPSPDGPVGERGSDVDLASLGYDDLRKLWKGFVISIRQKKPSLGISLLSGTLKSFDEKMVTLVFSKGLTFQKDIVAKTANKKYVADMAKKYFGRNLDITCFVEGEEAQMRRDKVQRAVDDAADGKPTREIENKPIVKKILTDFDGEIIQHNPR